MKTLGWRWKIFGNTLYMKEQYNKTDSSICWARTKEELDVLYKKDDLTNLQYVEGITLLKELKK